MINVDIKNLTPRKFWFNGQEYSALIFEEKISYLSSLKTGDLVNFSHFGSPATFQMQKGKFKKDGRFKKETNRRRPLRGNYELFDSKQAFVFVRFGLCSSKTDIFFPVKAYLLSIATGKFYLAENFAVLHLKKI